VDLRHSGSSHPHCTSLFSHLFFFFHDSPPTQISTLSLHDALPISLLWSCCGCFKGLRWAANTAVQPLTLRNIRPPQKEAFTRALFKRPLLLDCSFHWPSSFWCA